MGRKLYKYVGPETVSKVFAGERFCSLKCSYPKDFNDPYELFLTIDFNQEPDVLAYYAETIGSIPQYPTTCFSISPAVMPMWGHYAQNAQGLVVEIDEEELRAAFKDARVDDVRYQDHPDSGLLDLLHRAANLLKPRYLHFFQQGVLNAAYFTKSLCWSYERERRLVVANKDVIHLGEHMLLQVPVECVSALIVGPRADLEAKKGIHALADRISCEFYEMGLGRSSATPYFVSASDEPFLHADGNIRKALTFCSKCKEPTGNGVAKCSWCGITGDHREEAAAKNTYRLLESIGLLDKYIEGLDKIRSQRG